MLLTVRGVDGRTMDRQQRTASDHNSPSPVFGSGELRIEQMLTRNVNQNQNSCSVMDLHETLQKKNIWQIFTSNNICMGHWPQFKA